MRLEKLLLTNYKNIDSKSFVFKENIICLVGENGVGKSNILSSIYHLCFGKSFINSHLYRILNLEKILYDSGLFNKNNSQENLNFSYKKGKTKVLKEMENYLKNF